MKGTFLDSIRLKSHRPPLMYLYYYMYNEWDSVADLAILRPLSVQPFGLNSTKFCIYILWAPKMLEMQKLTTQIGGGSKNETLGPCTKLNLFFTFLASWEFTKYVYKIWLSLIERARIFIFDPLPFFWWLTKNVKNYISTILLIMEFVVE